ncbi:MAG TPA: sodium:proton exchanger [Bacteroidales bacterium]|nr:sodium:proton exchanger [Bacteroidales bacterium]
MNSSLTILFLGAIIFLAHWFSGIFDRKGIPDVLLLMLVGVLLGPILRLVKPDDFGIAGPMFTSLTLVIILFESGIGLNITELRKSLGRALSLTAINFIVTTVAVSILSYSLFNLSILESLTLGATLGGTSSAVVIPMVRQISMQELSRTYLILESALSDVLCIVFALALIEGIMGSDVQPGLIVGKIISSFVLASIVGFVAAVIWAIVLNRIRSIKNSIFTTPAFVFIVYGIAELLGYSGAISSLVFGITLVNIEQFRTPFFDKYLPSEPVSLTETERVFFSEIVFLLKTFFFVYVGISIHFDNFIIMGLGLLFSIILYMLRIPVIKFSARSNIQVADKITMSVMIPKGLAAAVLAGIPLQKGIPGGQIIQDLTYSIILITIVITSVLIPLFGRYKRLKAIFGWFFRASLINVKPRP